MDKLKKEQYREYLEQEIDYLSSWKDNCILMNADIKVNIIRTRFEMMKELYKLENEKE